VTDLEISKALALAIGWTERQCAVESGVFYVNVSNDYTWHNDWKVFDYRDWTIAGPVAERYNAFPIRWDYGWEAGYKGIYVSECTPQKAIALAVIGVAK
jgi:hypothetical protein